MTDDGMPPAGSDRAGGAGSGGAGRADADRVWDGFPRDRALAWTRVLRMHWPDWPGMTAMRTVTTALEAGRPAALDAWAVRARQAEALGFTPALYDRLHRALDEIPAVDHPAHPDNDPDPRWPVHTIRAFDALLWSDWPWLVDSGWTDDEAAHLLLVSRTLAAPPA